MTRISREMARQASGLIESGARLTEVAESWDVGQSTLHAALKRHNLSTRKNQFSLEQHLKFQQVSGIPPELYAYRAGIGFPSLRRAAWLNKEQLVMNTYQERKDYWTEHLMMFRPKDLKAFCVFKDAPIQQVAYWFHRLHNPEKILLWGFSELMTLSESGKTLFNDIARFESASPTEFYLGHNRVLIPIPSNIASEVYRHACSYQQR